MIYTGLLHMGKYQYGVYLTSEYPTNIYLTFVYTGTISTRGYIQVGYPPVSTLLVNLHSLPICILLVHSLPLAISPLHIPLVCIILVSIYITGGSPSPVCILPVCILLV